MKLSKSEKVLLKIMNELDWFGVGKEGKKIKGFIESYFIEKGWMDKEGSFKVNEGGVMCLGWMEKMGWL